MGEMSSKFFSGSRPRGATLAVAARILALAAVASLSACKTYDSLTQRVAQSITPYRITVVQGNFVSAEAASKLRVGMSRDEVRGILGTPLLTDVFHADRWDYVFYFKRGSTSVVQQRDLVINFAGDRVASWSGADNLPSEYELIAEIDGDRKGLKKAAEAAAASAASASAAAAAPSVASTTQAAPAAEPAASPGTVSALPPSQAANEEAAAAANRATAQVAPPSKGSLPSARANTPLSNGVPPNTGTPVQPQIQYQRQPQGQAQQVTLPPTGVAPSPDASTGLAPANASNLPNQPLLAPNSTQGTGK